MFKNKFKKLTGFFLAAVMTLVALPIHTLASEWGVGDNVYAAMLGNYIGSDGGEKENAVNLCRFTALYRFIQL